MIAIIATPNRQQNQVRSPVVPAPSVDDPAQLFDNLLSYWEILFKTISNSESPGYLLKPIHQLYRKESEVRILLFPHYTQTGNHIFQHLSLSSQLQRCESCSSHSNKAVNQQGKHQSKLCSFDIGDFTKNNSHWYRNDIYSQQ